MKLVHFPRRAAAAVLAAAVLAGAALGFAVGCLCL